MNYLPLVWFPNGTLTIAILAVLATASPGFGQTDSAAQFHVDPTLFHKVYSESRAEAHNHHEDWMVTAAVAARGTTGLTIESDQFATDYSAAQGYLPAVFVGVSRGLWQGFGLGGEGGVEVGYASLRGTIAAESKDGIAVEDNMVLQVLPIVVRHTFLTESALLGWVRPLLAVEAEQAWMNQVGSIDGTATSTWQSALGVGLGMRMFVDEATGFGGLTVSSTLSYAGGQSAGRISHAIGSRLML